MKKKKIKSPIGWSINTCDSLVTQRMKTLTQPLLQRSNGLLDISIYQSTRKVSLSLLLLYKGFEIQFSSTQKIV